MLCSAMTESKPGDVPAGAARSRLVRWRNSTDLRRGLSCRASDLATRGIRAVTDCLVRMGGGKTDVVTLSLEDWLASALWREGRLSLTA